MPAKRLALVVVVVAIGYGLGAELAWSWFGADAGASFFPAAGVTLAAVILCRRSLWPAILAAAAVAEIVVDLRHGLGYSASVGYAVANVAQPALGGALVRHATSRCDLARLRDLAAFLAFGVVVGPAVGGALGATTLVTLEGGDGWWRFFAEWLVGDGLGALVVGGAAVAVAEGRSAPSGVARLAEALGVAAVCTAATVLVFWWDVPAAAFVVVTSVLWLGFRAGPVGVAVPAALVAFIAAQATAQGHVFWDALAVAPATGLLYTQVTIAVTIAGGLVLAAAVAEREVALVRQAAARAAAVESDRAAVRSERLRVVAERVSAAATTEQVAEALLDAVLGHVAGTAAALMLSTEDRASLDRIALVGEGELAARWRARVAADSRTLVGAAFVSGRAVVASERNELERRFPETARALGAAVIAAAAVPIQVFGAVIGAVAIAFDREVAIARDDMAVLEAMTSAGGQGLERARLLDQERASRARNEMLVGVANRLASAATLGEVAAGVVAELNRAGYQAAEVATKRGSGPETVARSARVVDGAQGEMASLIRSAMSTGSAACAGGDGEGGPETDRAWSAVALPLRDTTGVIVGALAVTAGARLIDPGDRQALVALADQAGLALERVGALEERRRSAADLEQSHRFISAVTELVPSVLYVFDLERFRDVYVNREVGLALGYGEEQIDAQGHDAFMATALHEDDAARLEQFVAGLRDLGDGESRTVEYRLRHRDGSWRWYESRSAVFQRHPNGDVRHVLGVATDITARKRDEQALRVTAEHAAFADLLGTRLTELDDPDAILREGVAMLRTHLGARAAAFEPLAADGDVGERSAGRLGGGFVECELHAGRTVIIERVATDPRLSDPERDTALRRGAEALVVVPLLRSTRPAASLTVEYSAPRARSRDEIAILEQAADRVWSSAERACAEAALREREARYRSLFTSIDEGFCLCEMITDADGAPIDYRFLEVNARFEEQTGLSDPVGRTAYELVPDLEPHWVETYARVGLGGETLRFQSGSSEMGRWFDVFAAPIEPVGTGRFVLVFNDVTERRRAEHRLRESHEADRRARRRAELVAELLGELEAVQGARVRAQRLVELLVPTVADFATVEVPDPERRVMALQHRDSGLVEPLRALRGEYAEYADDANFVWRPGSGEGQLVSVAAAQNANDRPEAPPRSLLAALAPRSYIGVPLDAGLDHPGVLLLGLSDPDRRPYGPDDLAFVRTIAERAGTAIASARLREQEHEIALRLQQALLPDELASPPGLDVAAHYQAGSAALEVGGDWYDAFELPDGRLLLSVGDVVGHGLEAAAAMGRMRTALAALAANAASPGALLTALDQFASGPNGVEFATACCAILDPATATLTHASAGHPPILVVGADGRHRWLEDGKSQPVCGIGRACRPDAIATLRPGDLVVLYSDGLIERRGERISVGLDRLAHAATEVRDRPVGELCDYLLTLLTGDTDHRDDAVVLCLRLASTPASTRRRTLSSHPTELSPPRGAVREYTERQARSAHE